MHQAYAAGQAWLPAQPAHLACTVRDKARPQGRWRAGIDAALAGALAKYCTVLAVWLGGSGQRDRERMCSVRATLDATGTAQHKSGAWGK